MLKVSLKLFLYTLAFIFIATLSFSATIYLKDGTVLNGIIIETSDERIVIDTTVGLIEVPRYKIQDILYEGDGEHLENTSGIVSKNTITQHQADEGEGLFSEMEQRYKEIEEKKIRLYFMLHEKEFRDKMGIYEIQRLAGEIPYSERLDMYAAFEKRDQGLGAGLNFFIPSLGSWIQGDFVGALIQDGLLLVGAGLLYWNGNFDYENSNFYNKENGQSNMILYAGITVLAADWIFGIVRPFIYVRKWNKKLAASLRISVDALEQGYTPGPYNPYAEYKAGDATTAQLKIDILEIEY
jgi:hypothetical protein